MRGGYKRQLTGSLFSSQSCQPARRSPDEETQLRQAAVAAVHNFLTLEMTGTILGGLTLAAALLCCLSVVLSQAQAASANRYRPSPTANRDTNDDVSKMLLKSLRFRELAEPANRANKRQEEESLVNNLAALLSGLKERQVEPNLRMPSLRFGK